MVTLVLVFRRSEALAAAYGLAVTATILLVLALYLLYARRILRRPLWQVVALAAVVGGLELLLLAANIVKIPAGGWISLVIAAALTTIMLVWHRGARILFGRRRELEGPLEQFVAGPDCAVRRVPGLVVYPHGDPTTVPLALRTGVEMNRVLHEHVVIVTMKHIGVPHAHHDDRVHAREIGPGIVQVTYLVGFHDSQDVPSALRTAVALLGHPHEADCPDDCRRHLPALAVDADEAMYVLSVFRIEAGQEPVMPRWQKRLVRLLEKGSANRTQVLHLPPPRTVVMGAETVL
ncbi:MAG: KUP/HAK/KT family potassium transporter [Brachybacterium sp.]|uniref:KUP/HAK/KT family potassium transporter n=1 Tax=Brachybacterium sp. TaxID=1891286 RepID=UPI003241EA0C